MEAYVESTAHMPRTRIPAILVVVSEGETNIFDQRSIEEAILCANPSLRLLRRSFKQLVGDSVIVENTTSRLFV